MTQSQSNRAEQDRLFTIRGLKTYYHLDEGLVRAVDGVDVVIYRGETLCVVGESGCGKSVTGRSILNVVEAPGRIEEGEIIFHRRNENSEPNDIKLTDLNPRGKEIRKIRGREISMIFQEPLASLSPVHTVKSQMVEFIQLHLGLDKQASIDHALQMLDKVGIPKPNERIEYYPFQLSGGMQQRVVIARAISCSPALIIADEPTTALDVTTQAQIIDLMQDLQEQMNTSIMMITHDLGVVAEMADRVVVMYLGWTVETGDIDAIFNEPLHPYTRALMSSIPRLTTGVRERLSAITGSVPDPYHRPAGCVFHPRCDKKIDGLCDVRIPPTKNVKKNRFVCCWLYDEEKECNAKA